MLKTLIDKLSAPRKLRETECFLTDWCPKGVEVVNDGKSCWLHFGGMVYSLDYQSIPSPEHVPFMGEHLENHKWCLALVGGVYTRRSLLEAWARKYIPTGNVVGASEHDIIYPNETQDRPLLKGLHTVFAVTHANKFVITTKERTPLPWLTSEIIKKTKAISTGENIYFRGNF